MTDPAPDSPQDLAAAYALGALPPDEARQFEAFLATSAEAQREVAEYREVAALLALGGPPAAPDGALRRRVLARVAEPERDAEREAGRRFPAAWIALAASLILAVGLGASLLAARGRLADMAAQLRAREAQLAATRRALGAREAMLHALLEPGVEMFQLTAQGDPEPGIQLFWNRGRHLAVVHGFRLKPIPGGKAYQLWFIQNGAPVPSVTFRPAADGSASIDRVPVPEGGAPTAVAVTVEPETGSSKPTSPIVMSGALRGS